MMKPSIDLYPGVRVDKDTVLEYKNENVKQTVKGLVFRSVTTVKGENYTSKYDTTIQLQEGDTYDMAAIRIRVLDENGNPYSGWLEQKEGKYYLNENGNVVVSFPEYSIAPGSMGIQEFVIQ